MKLQHSTQAFKKDFTQAVSVITQEIRNYETGEIQITYKTFPDAESAENQTEEKKDMIATEYDESNPEHVARFEELYPDKDNRFDPNELDAHGNKFQFTDYSEPYEVPIPRAYKGDQLRELSVILDKSVSAQVLSKRLSLKSAIAEQLKTEPKTKEQEQMAADFSDMVEL